MGASAGSAPPTVPDTDEILKVLRRLVHAGDHRGVIRLVERWAEVGEINREARLEEARAFLSLRLMDRAWVRLKEVSEADPADAEALVLTATVYIERGWPARARRLIDRIRQLGYSSPTLPDLSRRADLPPVEPPADAREIEREGSPAQLVTLAEVFMATGSFVRARGLLERARRAMPSDRRVELLLWGLQGEFSRRGETLADLLNELSPPVPELDDDWDTAEHTDVGAVSLSLSEAATTEVAVATEESADISFPALFRRPGVPETLDPGGDPGTDEEPTMATLLTGGPPLPTHDIVTDPGTDANVVVAAGVHGGDTQIMAILPGPGQARVGLAEGPMHRPREGGDGLKETLNLKAWQQSMGVGAGDSQIPMDRVDDASEDFLEDEDQDLVVMTRREVPAEEPAAPATPGPRKPIEVLEKYPQPPPGVVPPSVPRPAPTPAPTALDDDMEELEPEPPTNLGRLIGVMLLTASALVVAGLGLVRVVQGVATDRVLEAADEALASGDATKMEALAQRLEGELAQGSPPLSARALAAAKLRVHLWTDQLAEPDFRDLAQQDLAFADAHGAPAGQVALGRAQLALSVGDLAGAERELGAVPGDDPEARVLAARVHLHRGHGEQAVEALRPLTEGSRDLELRLLWADALATAGQADEAARVRAEFSSAALDAPPVFLARHEQRWDPMEPDARIAAVSAWLQQNQASLSPRAIARAQTVRAELLARRGRADEAQQALDAALAQDPGWGPALYLRAGLAMWDGELAQSEAALSRCLELRRMDADCQRGMVQVLLEQGRVEDAAALLPNAAPVLEGLLDAWVAVARGEPDRALAAAAPVSETAPDARPVALVWYVRGLALREQDGEGADAELRRAFAALLASRDWMDRRLAGALALQDDAWTHAEPVETPR